MWKNVEKCGKMWKNVEKCGKMWKMWKMWKNVEKRTVTPFCTELYGYRSQHRNMIIRFLKLHFCSLNRDLQMCNEFFFVSNVEKNVQAKHCLLYTSPSPRDGATSRMPSSA